MHNIIYLYFFEYIYIYIYITIMYIELNSKIKAYETADKSPVSPSSSVTQLEQQVRL